MNTEKVNGINGGNDYVASYITTIIFCAACTEERSDEWVALLYVREFS